MYCVKLWFSGKIIVQDLDDVSVDVKVKKKVIVKLMMKSYSNTFKVSECKKRIKKKDNPVTLFAFFF